MPIAPNVVSRAIDFRPAEISSLVNRPVVHAHGSEAAALWTLRTRAASAPHYRLARLRKIDLRVLAHLEGLRIAGEEGWRTSEKALADLDGGALFVAAFLAFELRDAGKMYQALQLALTDR